MNKLKHIRLNYKAEMRLCHPIIVKILNTENPHNKKHFQMRKILDNIKSSPKRQTQIKSHHVAFPNKQNHILINGKKYSIKTIETNLFNHTNIITPITLKYKVWLTIKFIQKL